MDIYYEMEAELYNIKTLEQADSYIENNIPEDSFDNFYEFLNYYISEKRLSVSEIIQNSGLNKNYAYNIINGTKKNPGRDKIIAICIAMKLDIDETNMALRVARKSGFDFTVIRNIWIAGALQTKTGNVGIVNEYLQNHGLDPLDI